VHAAGAALTARRAPYFVPRIVHQTRPSTSNSTPSASRYTTHIGDSPLQTILAATLRAARWLAMTGAMAFTACAHGSPPGGVALTALPGWADDDLAGLGAALTGQCQLARPPQPWPALCRDAIPPDPAALRAWLEQRFRAWPLGVEGPRTGGLITGYYEPVLTGSRDREGPAQTPVYALPPRPAAGAGHPPRAGIETATAPIAKALLWLDDEVEAFFLHIQGSGRVRLRDGTTVRMGYAGHNGHTYVPIGRVLIERGELTRDTADMQGIRAWLRTRLATDPERARDAMRANPRYIFFRELGALPADAGPPGSLGVPLTALRSVATDPRVVPPGALLFVDTSLPDVAGSAAATPFARVVVSQDTGSAITGVVRADLFTGTGAAAGELAGRMRQRAKMWLLWPADATPAISPSAR